MVSRLPLAFVLALGSATLVSCLAGSDDDDGSANHAGTGGATAGNGGSTSGAGGGGSGAGGDTSGGTSGSGSGGKGTGGSSGTGTGGSSTGGTGTGGGDTGGAGGSDTGGTGGRGISTGGSGGSEAGTGGMACCLAIPVCDEDETEVSGPDACPPSATCRELSLCCSTIWCSTSDGSAGKGGMGGSGGNPASCDPELEHDREYVGDSPAQCAVILYDCPDHTEAFSNDCGCGCEQSADCPEFVDCMPGSEPRPGCSADERARCPYTDVAF